MPTSSLSRSIAEASWPPSTPTSRRSFPRRPLRRNAFTSSREARSGRGLVQLRGPLVEGAVGERVGRAVLLPGHVGEAHFFEAGHEDPRLLVEGPEVGVLHLVAP